jgi:NADH:ubiquinone oxidoreductase subunit 6 (subunit J)
MKIIQILIVIGFVIYIVFSSINMMEQYSEEAKKQFRSERNWKIGISIIIFILLYFAGTFNLIIP